MKIKYLNNAYVIGVLLVTAASVAWLMKIEQAKFVFGTGALIVILYHFITSMYLKDDNFIQQRLQRIGMFSSLLLGLGTYSMFDHSDLWVPSILIYALVTLYRSFRSA